MTHDPRCPTQTMCKCKDQECWDCRDVVLCQCDLIAKVRADELRRPSEDGWVCVWQDGQYVWSNPR